MSKDGRFSLILPFDQLENSKKIASKYGMHLRRQTFVRPMPGQSFKRVLLEFGFGLAECETNELTIERVRHDFTDEYEQLTRDFHLRFANRKA